MLFANSRNMGKNIRMKGSSGNLIITLREGEAVKLDGPGTVLVKQVKKNKVVILINADNETNIKRESTEEVGKHLGAKD